jgi:hypothetical protein
MRATRRTKPTLQAVVKDVVVETDLRGITRDSKRLLTVVTIDLGWDKHTGDKRKIEWLTFGQCSIRTEPSRSPRSLRREYNPMKHKGASVCGLRLQGGVGFFVHPREHQEEFAAMML